MADLQLKVRPYKGAKLIKTWVSKDTTIQQANAIIIEHLGAPQDAFLSLNAREPLGDPDQLIGSLLVQGDEISPSFGLTDS